LLIEPYVFLLVAYTLETTYFITVRFYWKRYCLY